VTARSAYRHPIARVFTGAVSERLPLSGDMRDRICTAVHEALMNALLHGNLGLGSETRDTMDGVATLHETIEARLRSPAVALSPIRIDARWTVSSLRIVVRDNGMGFDRVPGARFGEAAPTNRSGAGRGLAVLEAMCDGITLRLGGTSMELEFRLEQKRRKAR
jgi:anti-sigma regulatory factor (Ser/Thr protein kinase)